MADADHNPTRRALLGAALGAPLCPSPLRGEGWVGVDSDVGLGASESAPSLTSTPTLPSPLEGEGSWSEALTAFHAAQAEVRRIEAATAGGSAEEEEAWLPAHDAACGAMSEALERLLAVPAPSLPALAAKLDLVFAHAIEPGAVEDEVAEAVLGDSRRLLAAAC